MFFIDDELTIHITRGDAAVMSISANVGEAEYEFKTGDVVRFKVFTKKDCSNVVIKKDVEVKEPTSAVEIVLDREDTKVGEIISKPTDYWYEVELNPETHPQTIVGYDDNGAKVFRLYPEGGVANE
ncbi:MAG: hypothetical protein IJ370_00430 [Oscillospiraceae bacterium]|nr:hypothetical protein [Oscillospiraceae bacterium]